MRTIKIAGWDIDSKHITAISEVFPEKTPTGEIQCIVLYLTHGNLKFHYTIPNKATTERARIIKEWTEEMATA